MRAILLAVLTIALASCSGGGPGPIPSPSPSPTPTPSPSPTPCAPTQRTMTLNSGRTIHIMLPQHAAVSTCSSNLLYSGGNIQTAPQPYLVFWGNWSQDPDNVKPLLTAFYSAAVGSAWLSTTIQYTQADGQHVGNSAVTVPAWVDTTPAPATPSDSDLANAAAAAALHFGNTSVNAVYVIALAHGIKPMGFGSSYCAWHSTVAVSGANVPFINLPYQPDAGNCGANAVSAITDGVTIVAGHEQAETETDPDPITGWADSQGAEIGDKCAWQNLQVTQFGMQAFVTQPLWSNAAGGCIQ